MATEYGFVYALTNGSMPGIFKIGFTLGHPKTRMDQLSGATSCPMPFEMAACIGVSDPRSVETLMHDYLSEFRINPGREFFKVSALVVQDLFRQYSSYGDDIVFTYELDSLVEQEEIQNKISEQEWKVSRFLAQCADPIYWPAKRIGFGLS